MWELLGKGLSRALEFSRDYAALTAEVDISRVSEKRRDPDKVLLLGDLEYFGLLFESLVIRDLRIYAQSAGGRVWHYRDSAGTEVDAIVENEDGAYVAVEIKLGTGAADTAARALLRFAANIDTTKTLPARALVVVTGNGFAHRRPDGVFVIPIATLTAGG